MYIPFFICFFVVKIENIKIFCMYLPQGDWKHLSLQNIDEDCFSMRETDDLGSLE